MKLEIGTITSFGLAVGVVTAAAADVRLVSGGWYCTSGYPQECTYQGANPSVRPTPDYQTKIYLGQNETGYQGFVWEPGFASGGASQFLSPSGQPSIHNNTAAAQFEQHRLENLDDDG